MQQDPLIFPNVFKDSAAHAPEIGVSYNFSGHREKNIEKQRQVLYNCSVKKELLAAGSFPTGKRGFYYGKKSWNHLQRHPLSHHPSG